MACWMPASSRSVSRPIVSGIAACLAEVSFVQRGPLDLIKVASDIVAMATQDIGLVTYFVRRADEEVAGVTVLRDEAQRLPHAVAANHDRWMRARDWRGTRERPIKLIVRPDERSSFRCGWRSRPHLMRYLQCLLEHLEPLRTRWPGTPSARASPSYQADPTAK